MMNIFIGVAVVAIAAAAYFFIWKRRAPKFTGLTEQDFTNVSRGIIHPELEAACASMLKTVSDNASKALGKSLNFTYYTVAQLVQIVEVVDSLPGGAAGDISRMGPGQPTTMKLVRGGLGSMLPWQHELVHRVVWDSPDLTAECNKYVANGNHWPVIFDPFGSH